MIPRLKRLPHRLSLYGRRTLFAGMILALLFAELPMMPISATSSPSHSLSGPASPSSQIEPVNPPGDGSTGALALTLSEGAERPDAVAARPVAEARR